MHLFENLARIFKLLLKSNRKKKHLYSLKEHMTRKLHRSQKKTNPRVLLHLRHQPADLVTVSPMLNARNLANLATSPSIALRKRTPAQIHAMNAVDDASEASEDESVIILTQVHNDSEKYVLTQKVARKTINSDLVLLDSQSMVNLFTNPEHVCNIHPATTPINVHCNKGTLTTNEEADFGEMPVYLDDRGIANVLSFYCLGRKFKVTYDRHISTPPPPTNITEPDWVLGAVSR